MSKRFVLALAIVALVVWAGPAVAQVQTGEIFGRAADATGGVLPGVTVTISGPALLQPQAAVTSETGTYVFPRIPIGTYEVKFELAGFKTQVFQDIRVTIGFRAQVNAELEVSAVEETITVTGESPVIDTRETGTQTTFSQELLQSIPSARDPWVMLERTPGIAMDRSNVGGSQSGQQSTYVSRGAFYGNNKWSIDGVDITDMAATGASPMYYDFDMIEEMQVTTGGADASQQTGGVGVNFVTRSGTDRFRGSGRFYVTDDQFQTDNVDAALKAQKAASGNPIQSILDYGVEVGGPIIKSKLWYWGSYGKQNIKVGILNFYKNTADCRPAGVLISDIPLLFDTDKLRSCLETDETLLNNYNWKIQWTPFADNKFAWQNTFAEKVRNARDASDTRPIETTYRQKGVPSEYGTWGWKTGPTSVWKASDQHIITDRWLLEVLWGHVGNNFVLDFHEDSLATKQPRYEITTGVWGRSYQQAVYVRPNNSIDVNTNYFMPGTLGGDHQFKAGFRWREAPTVSLGHWGGNAYARFRNGVAAEAQLYRDSASYYDLQTYAAYVQDTFTTKRLTLNLGARWDRQWDAVLPASVTANPIAPQWLPAVNFAGAETGIKWDTLSPRLGMTYDLQGNGKTVAKASFSIYYGQLNPGGLASTLNPVTAAYVRFPWTDLDSDTFIQANEITYSTILAYGGNYNPDNPSFLGTTGTLDKNIKDDRTREFIVGLDHELFPGFALSASYIWRKYDQFSWNDTTGFGSDNYVLRTYPPPASACPVAGSRCETVSYYEPTVPIPAPYIQTNRPDYWRGYNGFELAASKRLEKGWALTASVAYNSAPIHYDSSRAYEDPTNVDRYNGAQYAPESTTSGIDNVYINAKWLAKVSGIYQLPWWQINLSGFYNARQGYPFMQAVRTPSRANRAGTADVLLDNVGDNRLVNLQTIDFRVDRPFAFGTMRIIPSMDVFNLGNVNTVLAKRRLQNATNANIVSAIVSPRVIRFGVRVTW